MKFFLVEGEFSRHEYLDKTASFTATRIVIAKTSEEAEGKFLRHFEKKDPYGESVYNLYVNVYEAIT